MMQSRGRPNRITKPAAATQRPNRRIDNDQLAQRFSAADDDSDLYQAVHRAAAAAANAEAQHQHHDGVIDDAGDAYKDEQDRDQGDGDGDADADPDPDPSHGPHVDVMDHDMPMAPMTPDEHHHHHHQAMELTPPEMLPDPDAISYAAAATDLHSPVPPPPPVGSTMPAPQPLVAATDFQPNPPPPSSHTQPSSQQAPPPPLAPVPSQPPQPPHKSTEQLAHESGYAGFKVDSAFAKRMARDPGQRLAEQRRLGQDLNLVRRSNVEALFAQIAGSEAANPCSHCRKGQGPWTVCVVYSGQMMGSCANCWFNASGSRCSFHGTCALHCAKIRLAKGPMSVITATALLTNLNTLQKNHSLSSLPNIPTRPFQSRCLSRVLIPPASKQAEHTRPAHPRRSFKPPHCGTRLRDCSRTTRVSKGPYRTRSCRSDRPRHTSAR